MRSQRSEQRKCVLIPSYQEAATIGAVVRGALEVLPDVIVVDDGSTDDTADQAHRAGASLLQHSRNMGKGASLNTGFRYVREHGFECVICMDGDGQHNPADIRRFIAAYERTGIPVLIGNRMANPAAMPFIRRYTNRFMSWLLSRSMGQYVPDTQCGFRLYRCDALPYVEPHDRRFAAESEILLHGADRNIRMGAVPVAAVYGGTKSQIKCLRDTWLFVRMLWRYNRQRQARPSQW